MFTKNVTRVEVLMPNVHGIVITEIFNWIDYRLLAYLGHHDAAISKPHFIYCT